MDQYISSNADVSESNLGKYFDKIYDKDETELKYYSALMLLKPKK